MLSARRDESGLGVAEVLLASSLVLVAVLGCVRATVAAVAAQGRAAAREQAVVATYDAVDLLRAGGCLFLTGAETQADAALVADRCGRALRSEAGAPVGGGTGLVDDGRRDVEVAFSSRWVGPDAPADPPSCSSAFYARRPTGVERTVSVTHREAGQVHVERASQAIEVVPADRYVLRSAQRSNLVVAGEPGSSAELTGAAGVTVRRTADPSGCIWFPALTTGAYSVRLVSGGGAASVLSIDFHADARRAEPAVVRP